MGCFTRRKSASRAPPSVTEYLRQSTMQLGQLAQTKVEPARILSTESIPAERLESVVDWGGVVKMYRFINNRYPPREFGEEPPAADADVADGSVPAAPHRSGSSFYIRPTVP